MKYGVLETTLRHVEGDERSRTHPGHGYPAHTVKDTKLHEFDNEEGLNEFLKQKDSTSKGLKNLRIIRFEDVVVKRNLSFFLCSPNREDDTGELTSAKR